MSDVEAEQMDLEALFYAVGQLNNSGELSPAIEERIDDQISIFHGFGDNEEESK